jgi:hypothetical protein
MNPTLHQFKPVHNIRGYVCSRMVSFVILHTLAMAPITVQTFRHVKTHSLQMVMTAFVYTTVITLSPSDVNLM